jgi:hypothetical protein
MTMSLKPINPRLARWQFFEPVDEALTMGPSLVKPLSAAGPLFFFVLGLLAALFYL